MLAGWWFQPTPLKNMSSSVGITIPNIWKVIKFHGSKPPTSWRMLAKSPISNGENSKFPMSRTLIFFPDVHPFLLRNCEIIFFQTFDRAVGQLKP